MMPMLIVDTDSAEVEIVTVPGDSPTDTLLRMLVTQVEKANTATESLRSSLHEEIAAMNVSLAGLAKEVRDQLPTIAVLTRRADEQERAQRDLEDRFGRELQAIRDQRMQDRDDRKWTTSQRVTLVGIAVTALVAVVFGILSLTIGG
ncbi:hypothetical protein FHX69_4114 [Prauserella muralis]|nr:hypothetical protein FHX69_4114 [Prauserella muralis]